MTKIALTIALTLVAGTAVVDREVGITNDMPSVTLETENGPVEIERIQDPRHEISDEWALTSRPCPEFCISPKVPQTASPRSASWS